MRHRIYVLSHQGGWTVQCQHCERSALYNTQADAIREAKLHVGMLAAGILSQIIIQGANGQYRAEWTYGQDPFPPIG